MNLSFSRQKRHNGNFFFQDEVLSLRKKTNTDFRTNKQTHDKINSGTVKQEKYIEICLRK